MAPVNTIFKSLSMALVNNIFKHLSMAPVNNISNPLTHFLIHSLFVQPGWVRILKIHKFRKVKASLTGLQLGAL